MVMGICPDGQKPEMLHADSDNAFCRSCESGYLEIAKWLWEVCQTPDDQKPEMLHAQDEVLFVWRVRMVI